MNSLKGVRVAAWLQVLKENAENVIGKRFELVECGSFIAQFIPTVLCVICDRALSWQKN